MWPVQHYCNKILQFCLNWGCRLMKVVLYTTHTHTTTVLRPRFRDHPGEPVPQENFWTLWCKGRLTETDTPTIQLGATPSGLTSAHLHHPSHIFLRAGCTSCRPSNSVKALKATALRATAVVVNCSVYYTTLHLFKGFFFGDPWVSRHEKGKPFWILLEQETMGWYWYQLDHM